MPDTLRKDLTDLYWSIIDSLPASTVKEGNKVRQDRQGLLRKNLKAAPVDSAFGSAEVEISFEGWTHSGFDLAEELDAESGTYAAVGGPFEVERTARVLISVRHELPNSTTPNTVADQIVHYLFKAGTRLGSPSLVNSVTGAAMTERATLPGEKFHPGRIEEIRQTVTVIQDGRTLLAA